MPLKTVPTYTAKIYVGLKCRSTGEIVDKNEPMSSIQSYVDTVGLCVTIEDTYFMYSGGGEPGIIVGLINYPRFPLETEQIKAHALVLAEMLLKRCLQLKVSVVLPGETIMISGDEL